MANFWRFFILCLYICIAAEYRVIKRGVEIPLTGLILPHFVPVPSQDFDFQRDLLWSVLCSVKMRGDCLFC